MPGVGAGVVVAGSRAPSASYYHPGTCSGTARRATRRPAHDAAVAAARDEAARSRSSVAPVVTSTAFSTVGGAHIMNAASRSTPSDFEHSGDPRVS